LQRIGEGTEQVFPEVGEEAVLIPEDMCYQGDTIDSLVDEVDLTTPNGTPAQRRTYHNANSVVQGEQRGVYATEFLNSLSMSGVPPHTLTL
jgi:hypothetical protein